MTDILADFAALAEQRGFFKRANSTEELKTIENLYQPPKESELLDQAHPVPVVLFDAHDKSHGLIENLKEQHDIIVGLLNKAPNGLFEQTIYARANLLNEVVKIGMMLDKNDQTDLMILADDCAIRIQKQAWTWGEVAAGIGVPSAALYGILAAVGVASGGLAVAIPIGLGISAYALINHFGGVIDQGVVKNCDRAIKELQDVIDEHSDENSYIFPQIQTMIKNISYVKLLGEKALARQISANPSPDEIQNANKLIDKYAKSIELLGGYLATYIGILKSAAENATGESDSGFTAILTKVIHTVYPAEITDAITALETLKDSLGKSAKSLDAFKANINNFVDKNKEDLESAVENPKNTLETPKDSPLPGKHMKSLVELPTLKE